MGKPGVGPDGSVTDTVRGGGNVRCANGHDHVNLTSGYDPRRGDYLKAVCLTAGCGLQARYYKED